MEKVYESEVQTKPVMYFYSIGSGAHTIPDTFESANNTLDVSIDSYFIFKLFLNYLIISGMMKMMKIMMLKNFWDHHQLKF
tara:strand:+ start:7681 stop:7923 length:243 start_codon:yes stop_codon:yes gene_type:complete